MDKKMLSIFKATVDRVSGTHLKWMFSTQTVVQTDNDTRIMVNSKYLPSSGIASDVGGIISASSKKNTVNDTKIEMQSVTWQIEFEKRFFF